jgi:hypothetical protein
MMRESVNTYDTKKYLRPLTKRGRIILSILLVTGLLFSQRHQLHLFLLALSGWYRSVAQVPDSDLPVREAYGLLLD